MTTSPVICIEGVIGSGKTSLTAELSKILNLEPVYEPVDANPYLADFYTDQRRWAFPMQIELLHRRFALQQMAAWRAVAGHGGSILDRSLPGDRVFCRLHVRYANISEMEWETYERAYAVMTAHLAPPTLLLFLDVDPAVALERMQKRGRPEERGVPLEYLKDLYKGYLDLLGEIAAGRHAWTQGLTVKRIPWNEDYREVAVLADELRRALAL